MSIIPTFTAIIILALSVWCFARILSKTGRSPWWSLLMIIFPLNLVLIWVFAFVRWPTIETYGEPMPEPKPKKTVRRPLPSEDAHRTVNPHITNRKDKPGSGRASVPQAGSDS